MSLLGQAVSAAESPDWNDINSSLALERVYAFEDWDCLSGTDVLQRSVDDYNNSQEFLSNDDSEIPLSDMAALGSGNTSPECRTLLPYISRALYGSDTGFFDHFYAQGQDGKYYLKSKYITVESGEDDPNAAVIRTEIVSAAKSKGYLKSDGSPAIPYMYRNYVLRGPFAKCFKKASGSNTIFSLAQIDGGTPIDYAYVSSESSGTKVQVGTIMEAQWGDYFDGGDDGEWTCSEFLGYIKSNPDWFRYAAYDAAAIKTYLEDKEERAALEEQQTNVLAKLRANQEKLSFCIAASGGGDDFIKQPISNIIPVIQRGLIDNVSQFSYTISTASSTGIHEVTKQVSPEATAYIKKCLVDNIDGLEDDLGPIDISIDTTGRDTSQAGTAEEDNSCESVGDWAWALCPAVEAISGAGNALTRQISNLLEANRDQYTSEELRSAWVVIRNLALSALVAMMMIMVIATALDTQAFDAYTVKKALPRMVAAIIFIVLSWFICILLIDVFNAAGRGIMGIMTRPFGSGLDLSEIFDVGIGTAITNLLASAALTIGLLLVFVFFGFTIFMFILVAFLVLVLRQLFILALMLVAPLAILAWIFPGNDKLWKTWWGSFSKLLMMYPLIMAMLAAGRIFAFLTEKGGGSAGAQGAVLDPIITILAYTIPFALIPFTFKTAGGMFANLAGMANDKSKGIFDRAAKRRQAKAQRWAQGNAFKGASSDSLRGKFNKGVQMTANAKHFGGLSSLRHPSRIGSSIRSAVGEQEFEHAMEASEKTPGGKAFFASDDLMLAGLEGNGDREATMNYLRGLTTTDQNGRRVPKYSGAALDNMTAQVMRMRQQMGNDAFNIAALAKAPATGTAFVGEEAGRWHQLIAQNTHGDGSLAASIVAAGKSGFRSAQRYEVSEAGFGDHMQAIQMAGDEDTSAGDISNFIADRALVSGGAQAVNASRNATSAQMFVGAMNRKLDASRAVAMQAAANGYEGEQLEEATREFRQDQAMVANIHDGSAGAKDLVARTLADELFNREAPPVTVTVTGPGNTTITREVSSGGSQLDEINDGAVRGDRAFNQMRRDLERSSSLAARDAQARAATQPRPGETPQPPVGGGLNPGI